MTHNKAGPQASHRPWTNERIGLSALPAYKAYEITGDENWRRSWSPCYSRRPGCRSRHATSLNIYMNIHFSPPRAAHSLMQVYNSKKIRENFPLPMELGSYPFPYTFIPTPSHSQVGVLFPFLWDSHGIGNPTVISTTHFSSSFISYRRDCGLRSTSRRWSGCQGSMISRMLQSNTIKYVQIN